MARTVGSLISFSGRTDMFGLTNDADLVRTISLLTTYGAMIDGSSNLVRITTTMNYRIVNMCNSASPGCAPPLTVGMSVIDVSVRYHPYFGHRYPLKRLGYLGRLGPVRILGGLL